MLGISNVLRNPNRISDIRATFESKNANVKATEWYQKRKAFFSTPPFRAGIVRIFFTIIQRMNNITKNKGNLYI